MTMASLSFAVVGATTVDWEQNVARLEQRLAFLDGVVGEQSKASGGVRTAVVRLEQRVHAFEQRMDRRFDAPGPSVGSSRSPV